MTRPVDPDAGQLAELRDVAAQLAAARQLTGSLLAARDALVITLAQSGHLYGEIADAASMSPAGVSKLTRAFGLARYRSRDDG